MKKTVKKAITAFSALGSTVMLYGIAFAASTVPPLTKPGNTPQEVEVEQLIITILNYVLGISGLVAVVFLIIGGFSYITAQGNEEQTKKATSTLLNAVIGLIIIFAAFAIVYTVQKNIIGVDPTIK